MDPYSDEYMAQEDEWEREGLLDPEWEKQQRKVGKIFKKEQFIDSFELIGKNAVQLLIHRYAQITLKVKYSVLYFFWFFSWRYFYVIIFISFELTSSVVEYADMNQAPAMNEV